MLNNWETERHRLKREIGILSTVSFTGTVNLHAVLDTENALILLFDLVPGGDLFDVVSRTPLPEEQARYILIQILETLQYLHNKNIIHRDLKLENILIAEDYGNQYYRVKLADFGLSKNLNSSNTTARSVVGTPQYWAPEVLLAGKFNTEYDKNVDLWSLGCLMYVLVAGQYPFSCDSNCDENILNCNFVFDHIKFNNISDEYKDIIKNLLKSSPNDRIRIDQILESRWAKKKFDIRLPEIKIIGRLPIMINAGPNFMGAENKLQFVNSIPKKLKQPAENVLNSSITLANHDYDINKSTRENCTMKKVVAKLFNSHEVLEALVGVFFRFNQAYIVFKDNNKISKALQSLLVDIKELTATTKKVFQAVSLTCTMVQELIEDIKVFIDDENYEAAIETFDNLQLWVKDIIDESTLARQLYISALHNAINLVTTTRDTSNIEDINLLNIRIIQRAAIEFYRSAEFDKLFSKDNKNNFSLDYILNMILELKKVDEEAFTDIINKSSSTSATTNIINENAVNSGSNDNNFRTDLKNNTGSNEKLLISSVNELDDISNSSICTLNFPFKKNEKNGRQLITKSSNTSNSDYANKVAILIRGLEDLQKIVNSLETCIGFWDNIEIALNLVKKYKMQIVTYLKYHKSNKNVDRFMNKLDEYANMWNELKNQCDIFVDASHKSSETMRKIVSLLNETYIKTDAITKYYNSLEQNNKKL